MLRNVSAQLCLQCSAFHGVSTPYRLPWATAGTSLGDPIEVGAVAAVLVEGQNAARTRQPLMLYGSKSWVGHSG